MIVPISLSPIPLGYCRRQGRWRNHGGVLVDISIGGVMIKLVTPIRKVTNEFVPGTIIDVIIDDFPPLDGNIFRTTENLVAVSFFPDTTDQKAPVGEIMAAKDNGSSAPYLG